MTCPNPAVPSRDPAALVLLARQQHPADGMGRRPRAARARSTSTSGQARRRRRVDLSDGTVKASSVTCPVAARRWSPRTFASTGRRSASADSLYAVLDIDDGVRTYRAPTAEEIEGAERLATALLDELEETPDGTSPLARRADNEVAVPHCYGTSSTASTPSADSSMTVSYMSSASFARPCGLLMIEMLAEGMEPDRAIAIATYLGFCVDRIADYNSSFCQLGYDCREFRSHTFPRQAIAMVWDYIGDRSAFSDVSGSWDGAVRWIELAIRHCSTTGTVSGDGSAR